MYCWNIFQRYCCILLPFLRSWHLVLFCWVDFQSNVRQLLGGDMVVQPWSFDVITVRELRVWFFLVPEWSNRFGNLCELRLWDMGVDVWGHISICLCELCFWDILDKHWCQ